MITKRIVDQAERTENDFASHARNERHNSIMRTVDRTYNSLN